MIEEKVLVPVDLIYNIRDDLERYDGLYAIDRSVNIFGDVIPKEVKLNFTKQTLLLNRELEANKDIKESINKFRTFITNKYATPKQRERVICELLTKTQKKIEEYFYDKSDDVETSFSELEYLEADDVIHSICPGGDCISFTATDDFDMDFYQYLISLGFDVNFHLDKDYFNKTIIRIILK